MHDAVLFYQTKRKLFMKKYLRKTASYLLSLGLVFSMSGSLVSAESTTGDGTDNGYEIQEPADDEQQETASGDQEVTDNPKGTEDSETVVQADKTDGESDTDTPETSDESQTNTEPAPETEIQSTSDADTAEPESGDADTLNAEADI